MTKIEIEAIVPAHPIAVWSVVVDPVRWARGSPGGSPDEPMNGEPVPSVGGPVEVEALSGPADRVGALRRCRATLSAWPLFGARTVTWTEHVSDVACPWTVEWESLDLRSMRRWRLRLWLLEARGGQTRLRCRLIYVPKSIWLRCADAAFLRRVIAATLADVLARVAELFLASADHDRLDARYARTMPAPVLSSARAVQEWPLGGS